VPRKEQPVFTEIGLTSEISAFAYSKPACGEFASESIGASEGYECLTDVGRVTYGPL
jgi:hypothetical protein